MLCQKLFCDYIMSHLPVNNYQSLLSNFGIKFLLSIAKVAMPFITFKPLFLLIYPSKHITINMEGLLTCGQKYDSFHYGIKNFCQCLTGEDNGKKCKQS